MITLAAAHEVKEKDLNEAAYEAARLEHEPLLKFLASCGATLSYCDGSQDSPLVWTKKKLNTTNVADQLRDSLNYKFMERLLHE